MKQAIDKWTMTASSVLVLGALLACKHKTDSAAPAASVPTPIAAVSVAPLPTPSVTAAAVASTAPAALDAGSAVAAPALGDVKRYPGKEKAATGAVKVTIDESLVYNDIDTKTPSVASLTKDIFVFRLATLGSDWMLVDFPSGVGKLSPGWIEAKSVGAQVQPAVTHATVAAQTATAKLAASASAKPTGSAAPVASAAPAASVKPGASASPAASAKPAAAAAKVKPGVLAPPHK